MKLSTDVLHGVVKDAVQQTIRREAEGWPPDCMALWTYQPHRPEKPLKKEETPAFDDHTV